MAFHKSPFHATIVNKRFHGQGTIHFLDGGKLDAKWENGIAKEEKLTFADGLVYSEKDWDYCTEADRRFFKERTDGFIPGDPQLSNDPATQSAMIPIAAPGLEYGYYSPDDKKLHLFDATVVRDPDASEMRFLQNYSRIASS